MGHVVVSTGSGDIDDMGHVHCSKSKNNTLHFPLLAQNEKRQLIFHFHELMLMLNGSACRANMSIFDIFIMMQSQNNYTRNLLTNFDQLNFYIHTTHKS